MAWALVKWIEEDRISIISSTWIIEPNPIPESGFPIKGKCYWKKKTNTLDTLLMAVSGWSGSMSVSS